MVHAIMHEIFSSLAHSLCSFEHTEFTEREFFFAGMRERFIPANPHTLRVKFALAPSGAESVG